MFGTHNDCKKEMPLHSLDIHDLVQFYFTWHARLLDAQLHLPYIIFLAFGSVPQWHRINVSPQYQVHIANDPLTVFSGICTIISAVPWKDMSVSHATSIPEAHLIAQALHNMSTVYLYRQLKFNSIQQMFDVSGCIQRSSIETKSLTFFL